MQNVDMLKYKLTYLKVNSIHDMLNYFMVPVPALGSIMR